MKSNKKLEKKIIDKVYRLEAKKTAGYVLLRLFLGLFFILFVFFLSSALIDILNEQNSFDLLDFYRDDLEVIKRYFISNISDFYRELPQPLTFILLASILVVLVLTGFLIKNFNKIKNRLISLYKFYINKTK
ncbi:hypothetical protein HZA76_02820 [Candidatus Roizmanbacteria bacterium]|nr:hypothetical protein [Candidatus Roizmanbacteria bacterium]